MLENFNIIALHIDRHVQIINEYLDILSIIFKSISENVIIIRMIKWLF